MRRLVSRSSLWRLLLISLMGVLLVAACSGPEGDAGTKGDPGPKGAQGAAGPTGPQGAQGIAGVGGVAGSAGVQGDVGPMGPAGDPASGGASLYVESDTAGLPTAEPGRVRVYIVGSGFTPGDAAFVELLVPMDEDGFVTADGTLPTAIFAAGASVTPSGTFRDRTDFRVSIPEGIHTFRAIDGHGIMASTVIVVAEK